MVFALRLELLLGLRGNYVIVSMEIERCSLPMARRKTLPNVIPGAGPRRRFETPECQPQPLGLLFENLNQLAIQPARRILCRNGNEIARGRVGKEGRSRGSPDHS